MHPMKKKKQKQTNPTRKNKKNKEHMCKKFSMLFSNQTLRQFLQLNDLLTAEQMVNLQNM